MKYFDVKLESENYLRFYKYYKQIENKNKKDITYHWSKRDKKNYESFIFCKNNIVRVQKYNNTGLDDKFEELFNKNELKYNVSLKLSIKRNLYKLLKIYNGVNFDAKFEFLTSNNSKPIDISFINHEFGKKRKDFTIFKSIFIINDLLNSIKNIDINNKNILEIGPGVGNLIRSLSSYFNKNKFFIIDLDISLLFSILNILCRFPNSKYILPNEINYEFNKDEYDFIFLNNDQLNLLKKDSIDIAFNTMSFQEMPLQQIRKYFDLLRNVMVNKNIFYCLNAVEKKMQVNEQSQFIRFSEYPWHNRDKVFEFNLSEVHKNKTTKPFFRKIVRLNKDG